MLVDAHSHIHLYEDSEWARVEHSIDTLDIATMAVSVDIPSFELTIERSGSTPRIIPAFGIHPENAHDYAHRLDDVTALAEKAEVIGEIGLDRRFTGGGHLKEQQIVFDRLLGVAAKHGKVANLHTSGAEELVADTLGRHRPERVVVHWYNGPEHAFHTLAGLGCYFTFGPEVAMTPAIAEFAQRVHPRRLLTETDNPGGSEWLQLGRGEPQLIESVVIALARVRRSDPEELRQLVADNWTRLVSG